jgi:hypothetical protein
MLFCLLDESDCKLRSTSSISLETGRLLAQPNIFHVMKTVYQMRLKDVPNDYSGLP